MALMDAVQSERNRFPLSGHARTRRDHHLQEQSAAWVAENHPTHGDIWRRLAKLGEEVGELNRAIIGQDEGRPDRGDPQQEAAQAVLVLMSIAHLLGFDLIDAAYAEFLRATS